MESISNVLLLTSLIIFLVGSCSFGVWEYRHYSLLKKSRQRCKEKFEEVKDRFDEVETRIDTLEEKVK